MACKVVVGPINENSPPEAVHRSSMMLNKHLLRLLHGLPTSVVLVDNETKVSLANRHALKQFAFLPNRLKGLPLTQFVADPSRPRFEAGLSKLRADGFIITKEITLASEVTDAIVGDFFMLRLGELFPKPLTLVLICDRSHEQLQNVLLNHTLKCMEVMLREFPIGIMLQKPDGRRLPLNPLAALVAKSTENPDTLTGYQLLQEIAARKPFQFEPFPPPATHFESEADSGRTVQVRSVPIKIGYNLADHYLCTVEDVTEKQQTEEALRQSEQLFRTLAEQAPVGVYMNRSDGECIYLNPFWEKLTGYTPEESLGYNWTNILHPDDRGWLKDAWVQSVQEGSNWDVVHRLLPKDGGEVWIRAIAEPVCDEDGNVARYVGMFFDMTEEHAMQLALRDSETRYRALFEQNQDAIILIEADSRLVMEANPAMAKLVGLPTEQLTGAQCDRFVDCKVEGRFPHCRGNEGLEHQNSLPTIFECELRHQSGESIPVEVSCSRLQLGDKTCFLTTFRDLRPWNAQLSLLKERDELLHKLADQVPGLLFQFRMTPSGEMSMPFTSAAIVTEFGLKPEQVHTDAISIWQQIHPADLNGLIDSIRQSGINLTPWRHQYRGVIPGKGVRWFNGEANPERHSDGTTHWYGYIFDVTDDRLKADQLRLFASAVENSTAGIVICDADRRIVGINRAFTEITGYAQEEVIGQTPSFLKSGRHDDGFYQTMYAEIHEKGYWKGELWNRHKSGQIYCQWLTVSVVRNEQGQVVNYIGAAEDRTAWVEAERRLQHLAQHDPLTDLPNRALLKDRLAIAIQLARRNNHGVGVIFLDLDRFKLINDSLGHNTGDELLKAIASRLRDVVRSSDTVSRLGGDEFVILLPEVTEVADVRVVVQKLIDTIAKPIEAGPYEINATMSVGVAVFPEDGDTVESLLQNADSAMYHAKSEGRNQVTYYKPSMNADAAARLKLETDLHRALRDNEFYLQYQGIWDLRTGALSGLEALIRWQHPESGSIPPLEFIPLAEQIGLIVQIGQWTIREVCRQLREWQDAGCRVVRVSVNLSAVEFMQHGIFELIDELNQEFQIPTDLLEIELTESSLMRYPERTTRSLETLRTLGVTFALDDFGTGYSNMSYLKQFPIDRIKIDQSFVQQLGQGSRDEALVGAIIAMGQALGLRTLAEGVETREQLNFLSAHGCDEIQGYLVHRPVNGDEMTLFLKDPNAQLGRLIQGKQPEG